MILGTIVKVDEEKTSTNKPEFSLLSDWNVRTQPHASPVSHDFSPQKLIKMNKALLPRDDIDRLCVKKREEEDTLAIDTADSKTILKRAKKE